MNNFAGWAYVLTLLNVLLPAFAVLFAGHKAVMCVRRREWFDGCCFGFLGLMSLWLFAGELSGSIWLRTAPTRPLVARGLMFIGMGVAALGELMRRR